MGYDMRPASKGLGLRGTTGPPPAQVMHTFSRVSTMRCVAGKKQWAQPPWLSYHRSSTAADECLGGPDTVTSPSTDHSSPPCPALQHLQTRSPTAPALAILGAAE